MAATHDGKRLYKTPNKWNDWSNVEEVYVKGLIHGYVKFHYHGRMRCNKDICILENEKGLICTYHKILLRFKR